MSRPILHRYHDPVDRIWLATAERLGMRVARSSEVFASWDGRDTLTLSTDEHLDPDDSIAQLVLHEICHALVQGEASWRQVDWGLANEDDRHAVLEHACHRLQAALTGRYGLRGLFGVTTDWRPYWDALPADPLAPGDDPAIPLAREAWWRATRGPWAAAVAEALQATAVVASAARSFAEPDSLWATALPLHRLGTPLRPEIRCGSCAWSHRSGPGRVDRCRQVTDDGVGARVDPEEAGCSRYEPRLDEAACRACGACCREGFHQVGVGPREPFARQHPELLVRDDHGLHLPRPGGRCPMLADAPEGFTCADYTGRPRACRDFPVGGEACLEARRRVFLSAPA